MTCVIKNKIKNIRKRTIKPNQHHLLLNLKLCLNQKPKKSPLDFSLDLETCTKNQSPLAGMGMYDEARPLKTFKANSKILQSIFKWTGSQLRETRTF